MVVAFCTYTVKELSPSAKIETKVKVVGRLRRQHKTLFNTVTYHCTHLEIIVKCYYVLMSAGDLLEHCNLISDLRNRWCKENMCRAKSGYA